MTNDDYQDMDDITEDQWDALIKSLAVAHLRSVKYIPNPKEPVIYKATHTVTHELLTKHDIRPASKQYDWDSITSYSYIHIVRLHALFTGMYLSKTYVDGYTCKNEEPDKGYIRQNSYRKGEWGFRIQLRKIPWIDKATNEDWSRYMGYVTLYPKFRANAWEVVAWIEDIIRRIEVAYCRVGKRLRLEKIELPLDFTDGEYNCPSLLLCYWRRGANVLFLNNKDRITKTIYDAFNKSSKTTKIYDKEGCWHIEPTWRGRAFETKAEYKYFSPYSVLLFWLSIYETTEFRYLDIRRLAKSRTCGDKALVYWGIFKRSGIKRVSKAITEDKGYTNVDRLTSVHPFDSTYKRRLAETIKAGLQVAYERTKRRYFDKASENLNMILGNEDELERLKRRLALYARKPPACPSMPAHNP